MAKAIRISEIALDERDVQLTLTNREAQALSSLAYKNCHAVLGGDSGCAQLSRINEALHALGISTDEFDFRGMIMDNP